VPAPPSGASQLQIALAKYALCASCRAAGHGAVTDDADLIAEANKEVQDERWARAQEQWCARVPERFQEATSADPTLVAAVQSWRTGTKASLLAFGDKGVGKTHLGYAMLNQLVRERLVHPYNILAGSEADLLASISQGGFDRAEDLRRRVMNPRRWDIIMVDDVGYSTFNRNDRINLWRELADHMWANKKALIITTNLELSRETVGPGGEKIAEKPLETWVGDAAYDRITHMTNGTSVHIDGFVSMRRQEINALGSK
jgi:DNA replication protein DnaC